MKKVHSVGHRLNDTKVTVNRDFKFNVAGIKTEGTSGEVINMPQWIGKILSENNLATLNSYIRSSLLHQTKRIYETIKS